MIQVWFQRDRNIPSRINIDLDSEIDNLKQVVFDRTDIGQYQTWYKGERLRPWAKVPQDTADDEPIIFAKIADALPSESQEFAARGTCETLRCGGRPCAQCHLCRDWHFISDQNMWNRVRNWRNWQREDWRRWHARRIKLFKRRCWDGATCDCPRLFPFFYIDLGLLAAAAATATTATVDTVDAITKRPHNRAIAEPDLGCCPPRCPDDRDDRDDHICLCEIH
ncbi:unnamed protein product [Adineta steineri]|uniref:Uncharacterized protein n=1 Tax=Adineta steineri TaxID=433720 RepID=A0A819WAK9_9BILA|nr:unnamed protein product [Adineta steineri]CAF4121179.1 unnamed protein product [Adineta steineri]